MEDVEEKSPLEGTPSTGDAAEMIGDDNDRVDWSSMPEVAAVQGHTRSSAPLSRKLGVTWTNLTVKGVNAAATFNENVASQFVPSFAKKAVGDAAKSTKTIIDNSHGCVKPGEMLLVLGR